MSSIPRDNSDPAQTPSGSPSGSRPQGAQGALPLREILQTVPTAAAHPGVEEIRKIDPEEDKRRVVAFTQEEPTGKYTFDSRPLQSREGDRVQKLCRRTPGGGTSCIVLGLETERLFAAMQGQGYFCALPAEPNQTHMECVKIPK